MITDFYALCAADAQLVELLDSNDGLKIYLIGDVSTDVSAPYVTYQTISGYSYNALSDRSAADQISLQIDVWSPDYRLGHQIANRVRYAVELNADVSRISIDEKDKDSNLYRISFDLDFFVNRINT